MRDKTRTSWVILMISGFIFWGGCATQDDFVLLNNRIIALEQRAEAERQSLRSDLESYHEDQIQDSRSRYAEMRALLHDLRDEMMQLRGAVEEGQFGANQWKAHSKNLEASLQSLGDRIVRIEQYLGIQPSEKLAASGADQDEPIQGEGGEPETPEALYNRAKELFDKGEYEDARELLRSILNKHPKSKVADNAQYLLGEIYFHEKWYEKAILEYQKVIENYPKGSKTPGALLKQGFAFLSLGDNVNAGLILKELIRKFPDSDEAIIAKNKLKTLK